MISGTVGSRMLRVLLTGTLIALAPPSLATSRHHAGQVTLEKVKATGWQDETFEAEQGMIRVRSVRSDTASPLIGVGFHLFRSPAPDARTHPPVYILAGGPGSSVVSNLSFSKEIAPLLAFTDVVIPDQRGFIFSDPVVACSIIPNPDWHLQFPTDPTTRRREQERSCRAEIVGRGINPDAYVISELADDVNDLRQALGHGRIVLTGGSFGSQWAFAIMHRHPDIVARAVLSGIEGPDHGYDAPWGVLDAVRKIAADAEASPILAGAVPEGGYVAAIQRVLAQLERRPAVVAAVHPQTGRAVAVRITAEDVRDHLVSWGPYGLSDMDGVTRWPAMIWALDRGDYSPILSAVVSQRLGLSDDPHAKSNVDSAILLPIDCSYGITEARRAKILAASERTILGNINASYFDTCDIWAVRDSGKEIREGFRSDVPVLMIQGEIDTSTPLENAHLMHKLLPNSRLMVVQRGTHDAAWQVMVAHPDIWARVVGFIKDGTMPDLPAYLTMPPATYEKSGERH